MRTAPIVVVLALLSLGALACQGEKPGDPCDKFFQNTCKAPLSCVDMREKKVCAGSCDMGKTCKDPALEPSEVTYVGPGGHSSAGCYCLPK